MSHQDWEFTHLQSIASTNTYAKQLANSRPNAKMVVTTDYQTAGRGQFDRKWESLAGQNLLCSLLIPCAEYTIDPVIFNKYICCVIRQVIQSFTQKRVLIKWPNDLLIDSKKVAGILIENIYRGTQLSHIIVGIGINVNQRDFQEQLLATSLALENSKPLELSELLDMLLSTIEFDQFKYPTEQMKKTIDTLYHSFLYGKGQATTFIHKLKEESITGIIHKVDPVGNMIILKDGQQVIIQHGIWSQDMSGNLS